MFNVQSSILIQVDVFPLKFLFVLRLALVKPMAYGENAKTIEVIRDAKHTTDDIIGRSAIIETATAHLNPA